MSNHASLDVPPYEQTNQIRVNRVPTPREREAIQSLIKSDEEEHARLVEELNMLERQTTYHCAVLHNDHEALNLAQVLRMVKERSNRVMEDILSDISAISPDTSIVAGGDDYSSARYHRLFKETVSTRQLVEKELDKGKQWLAGIDEDLCKIKEDIDGEASILRTLELSKSVVKNSIHQRSHALALKKRIIHPRLFIPEEMWAKIFGIVVMDDETKFINGARNTLPPFTALRLSAVCGSWRKIITLRPELWHFVAIPHSSIISSSQAARIMHYVSLIRPHLPIAYTYKPTVITSTSTVELFPYLAQNIPQYEGIFTFGDLFSLTGELPFTPQVGTLCITAMEPMEDLPDENDYSISLSSLHAVKVLEFRSIVMELVHSSDEEDLPNLEEMVVSNTILYPEEVADWLSRMPGVKRMELSGVAITRNDSTPLEPEQLFNAPLMSLVCSLTEYPGLSPWILAPKLTTLTLILRDEFKPLIFGYYYYPDRFSPLPKNQTLPSLILVVPLDAPDDIDIGHFRRGSRRHGDEDTTSRGEGEDKVDAEIFRHFLAVSTLELDGKVLPSVLQILSTDDASLPCLQRLTISNSDVQESILSTSVSAYTALRQTPLSISFHNCTNLDVRGIKRIQDMINRT